MPAHGKRRRGVVPVGHAVARENIPVLEIQPDLSREIIPGNNCLDARQGFRPADINRFDQSVRVRAPLDAGMQ